MIITCFSLFEDILTNRSFFFQPSGSSKFASTDSKTKRGLGRLLKDGVKYNIDSIKASGEPLTPKNIANNFVRQCRVLVKDQLPISIQEWKEPKTKRPDVTWVDDRAKQKLWESLMEHFTLPDYFTDANVQKVKDAALKKMANCIQHPQENCMGQLPRCRKEDSRIQGNTREAKRTLGRFREIQGIRII